MRGGKRGLRGQEVWWCVAGELLILVNVGGEAWWEGKGSGSEREMSEVWMERGRTLPRLVANGKKCVCISTYSQFVEEINSQGVFSHRGTL